MPPDAEDRSAVRIEMDGSAATGSLPGAPEPDRSSSRLPVIGAVVAAIAVVAGLVFVALPEDGARDPGPIAVDEEGDDAAGDTPEAIDPVAQDALPVDEAGDAEPVDEEPEAEEDSPLIETDLAGNVAAVAPAQRGWIAVRSQDNLPELSRSLDGITWTPIDVEFGAGIEGRGGEIFTDDTGRPLGFVEFNHLIATDDGFAMVMTFTEIDPEAPPTSFAANRTTVQRLISPFGVRWEIDPDVPTIESDGTLVVFGHSTVGYSLVRLSAGASRPLAELLEAVLVEPLEFDPCFAELRGDDVIQVFPCAPGGTASELAVGVDDVIDPETFADLQSCVQVIDEAGPRFSSLSFEFQRFDDDVVRRVDDVDPLAIPRLLDDGSVIVVTNDRQFGWDESCSPWIEQPTSVSEALVWPPDADEPIRRALPPEIGVGFGGDIGFLGVTDAGEIRFTEGESVWSVGADGEVEELVESIAPTNQTQFIMTPDGTRLVRFVGRTIESIDIDSGEGTLLATDSSVGFISPVYLDDDVFFLNELDGDPRLHMLELR